MLLLLALLFLVATVIGSYAAKSVAGDLFDRA
jgi:hypothetical protein